MAKRALEPPEDLKCHKKPRYWAERLDDITVLVLSFCQPIDLFKCRLVCKLWSRCTPLLITDLTSDPRLTICDVLLNLTTNLTR